MTDFIRFEDDFSLEDRQVAESTRKFLESAIAPQIRTHFRNGTIDPTWARQFGQMGLFGASLDFPGSPNLSSTAYGLIMRELERVDSGIRSFVSVQSGLVIYPIWRYGSDHQKKTWLPRLASGEAIGCFGLTEPDFGSNPAGLRTQAMRDGKKWRLSGTKMWITNGSIADVAVIWARTDNGINGFLVPRGTPGFTATDIHGKWSMRASITSELVLDQVVIDDDHRLPHATDLKAALSCLSQARFGIAWGAIGAAEACYEEARHHVQNRPQFDDRPLASHQLIQTKLADMLTHLTLGQLLALKLARNKDAGTVKPAMISMAKRYNVGMALTIARNARDMLGASGITDEHVTIRHLMNLETVNTYEGTYDIHGLIIGQEITGIPAYSSSR